MRLRLLQTTLALCSVMLATSCVNLGYYMQSARGQIELLNAREPIVDVLAKPETSPELKSKLEFVLKVREFASRELKLPDNASYRGYADVKREHVVWNVFAAPEFSLELRKWCFLVAGCVRYRGYFAQEDAEELGGELRAQGLDVFVAGIDAYSTLGWFDDPVLNTFVRRSENFLAGLIFHELAHQRIYIADDTTFNESFARAVEIEGVRRWLARNGTPEKLQAYEREVERQRQFVAMVTAARDKLKVIYAGESTDEDKRRAKRSAIDELVAEYVARKKTWDGYNGYDKWFAEPLNNAKLGSVAAYTEKVPAFVALLRAHGDDFGRFYAAVAAIGKLPEDRRERRLAELAAP
jgi:predicted aminopeptidase